MGLIRQFLRDYGYVHKTDIRKSSTRAYAAASMGRLAGDWMTTSTAIDQDIRSGMIPVRARARDLSQNNEYARAYLRAVRKNIVGSEGFQLQVKSKNFVNGRAEPDRIANAKIENAFWAWSQPEFATVTGKISFRKAQELIVETCARDGEMFVRLIRGEGINRFGFTIQLIEPDFVDHQLNSELKNGNIIRMGIEVDRGRRPVAYHVSQRNNTLELYGSTIPAGPHIRIPARDVIHVFDPERADQTRGISWMAPAMVALHNLRGYVEAAVINARVGASKMGFFRDPVGSGEEYTGDTVDELGNKITTVEPGVFEDIGQKEFHAYDPKYPDQQFDPFVKSILRGISSGLGISFSSISNDLTEVNYSSIRAGLIEERETWKSLQAWFVESFMNRVYSEWLSMALMTQSIALPIARYEKFNQPQWTGRRWAWVDPLKDVQAAKEAVAAHFKSSTQVAAEMGVDIEDLYAEIKEEKELAEEYGITPDYGGTQNGKVSDGDSETVGEDGQSPKGNGSGEQPVRRTRVLVRGTGDPAVGD